MDRITTNFGEGNSGLQLAYNYGSIVGNFFGSSFNLEDKLPAVSGAAFDSYIDRNEGKCLPGTRTDILQQIREWAFSPRGKCIFWLNGMAGTGKSTISRTVAQFFSDKNSLGASFFFKRGEADRSNAQRLFPTIARQLIICIPQILPHIKQTILDNPDIIGKGLKDQFDKLLLQPLLNLETSELPIRTVVIVLDALDECEGDHDIHHILQFLPRLQKVNGLRIRVFLTSRPELPIHLGFSQIAIQDHSDLVLHEIPEEVIKHDISLFFHQRLLQIRRDSFLPDDWPGETNLEKLVALSIPLFIFAATICRIFEDPNWDPMDSLTQVLVNRHDQSYMDRTYLPVLDRLFIGQTERQKLQLIQEFQQVVGSIIILESPLSVISLSKLLNVSERLIQFRLRLLHSVLLIPLDITLPIRLFHLSFRDFLLDPETCSKTSLWVNDQAAHHNLTIKCLLVCHGLRKNICKLPNEGVHRAKIDHLTINHHIPPELQYSCRYWIYHLIHSKDLQDILPQALLFFEKHFLHWIEALALLGLLSEVIQMLSLIQSVIPADQNRNLSDFIHDAKLFVLKNRQIADEVPLQIYCAGLIFAPQTSIIRAQFKKELPTWIYRLPKTDREWAPGSHVLEGHSSPLSCVTFSPDGRHLASGSRDNSVRLWDLATGLQQGPLEHLAPVRSVSFSPDGQLIAAGSGNGTLKVWYVATAELQQTLECHSKGIISVKFSLDSRLLASVCFDDTVRLWDVATGIQQQSFVCSCRVYQVAFSPDGRLLASACDNAVVELWDLVTGTLQQTLQCHPIEINVVLPFPVTFSPCGRLLATGLWNTLQLWDISTGALQQTLNHSGEVTAVAYSPDASILASASEDGIIWLRDAVTYELREQLDSDWDGIESLAFSPDSCLLVYIFRDYNVRLYEVATDLGQQKKPEDHLKYAYSIAFSPDGLQLASGSFHHDIRLWDTTTGTVRKRFQSSFNYYVPLAFSPDGRLLALGNNGTIAELWDTVTGLILRRLHGHSRPILSVDFSPNGQVLASGSGDSSIRLWNPSTGAVVWILEGHSESVSSVAFSPNGRLLGSGSFDNTIRIWSLTTGLLLQIFTYPGSVFSIVFSPDSQLVAAGGDDKHTRVFDLTTGKLKQVLKVNAKIDDGDPESELLLLNTISGLFDGRFSGGDEYSQIHHESLKIYIDQNQWVNVNGRNVLWLPPDHRPTCSAIHENLLALGHISGRITFLGFCAYSNSDSVPFLCQ